MSNQLDNLFKNKLQNRIFEYDESSWDDARLLIEIDEKKRKRYKWFLFFSAFLLVGIISAGAFYLGQKSALPNSPMNKGNIIESAQIANTETKESKLNSNSDCEQNINTLKEVGANNLSIVAEEKIQTSSNGRNKQQLFYGTADASINSTKDIQRKLKENYRSESTKQTGIAHGEVEHIRPSDEPITTYYNPITATSPKQSVNAEADNNAQFLNLPEVNKLAMLPMSAIHYEESESNYPGELLPLTIQSSESILTSGSKHNWSFGLRGGAALIPDNFTDFEGGVFARFQVARTMAISLQPHYTYQKLLNTTIKKNEILDYGFGLRSSAYSLQAESIRSIHIPLVFTYSFGSSDIDFNDRLDKRYYRNQVSIGFSYIYMDGVTGVVNVKESAGAVAEFAKGWLDPINFNRHNTAAIFGYERYITQRISIGLMARYRLRDQFTSLFSQQNPSIARPQPFYFGLQAYYKLY